MNLRLTKKEKIILPFGILFLLLDIFFIIDFYIVGSVIGVCTIAIISLGTLRKKDFIQRVTKIAFVTFFLFIALNPAPQYWASQTSRRWMDNRTQLIEPDHAIMPSINASFQVWFENRNGITFNEDTDFEHKVREVDYFMLYHLFDYTLDSVQYLGYLDYLPTIDEILATNDSEGYLHDDCDGISIMTTSFLIYMGFKNCYISEVTYHYHTIVYQDGDDPKTLEGYPKGISLYITEALMLNDKLTYYMFNQTEMFIPPNRPLVGSLFEIFVDAAVWQKDITELFDGELTGLSPILNYIVLFAASVLLGGGIIYFTQLGVRDKYNTRLPKHLGTKYALLFGTILFGVMFLNNQITLTAMEDGFDLFSPCNPILITTLTTLLFIANRKFASEKTTTKIE
jgi:hypothetical protein